MDESLSEKTSGSNLKKETGSLRHFIGFNGMDRWIEFIM